MMIPMCMHKHKHKHTPLPHYMSWCLGDEWCAGVCVLVHQKNTHAQRTAIFQTLGGEQLQWSQRTNFTCPRPCLERPLFLRLEVIFGGGGVGCWWEKVTLSLLCGAR